MRIGGKVTSPIRSRELLDAVRDGSIGLMTISGWSLIDAALGVIGGRVIRWLSLVIGLDMGEDMSPLKDGS